MTESLLLRFRKAQTEALNEALGFLGTAEEGGETLSQEIRWLMEDCVRTSGRLKAAFDKGQRQWTPRPVEVIHEFYTEFLGIVDGQMRLADRVRERAVKACETGHEALDLQPLNESIQSLRKLRESVSDLCEWLISPVPAPGEPFPGGGAAGGVSREGNTRMWKTS